ncbi:MAG: tetratricopeptide repeat protein [Prevotellaceae bacterium]|jgi:tetratricopeptide (TPR) repeat protein|nr:tetratricopeptide repeat protein [Prevotellaceae bacterium]
MRKKSFFIVSALVLLTVFACKVPKEFLKDLKADPNPLELKGGKVVCKVEGTFPAKYFVKNMELTVVPVLKSKTTGATIKGTPKVFQGEKIKGNNPVISFKNGGKYEQTAEFDYLPEFEQAELYFEATAQIKKKTINFEPVLVATGIITTANLVYTNPGELGAKIIPDNFQKVIEKKEDSQILFLIQQSNIRNAEVKSLVDLTKKIQAAKQDVSVNMKGLEILSYASPDGGQDLNEKLAQAREDATTKQISQQLKKFKTEISIDGNFTAEDWEGFKSLMESSSIQDKDVILRVLSMYSDPDQREKEIKNLSAAYKEIADKILPQLRRSKLVLTTEVLGKSDEVITNFLKTNPSELSVEEFLYAATLNEDAAYKEDVYKRVIVQYPNEVRGYNNLGVLLMQKGDLDGADRNFTKALDLDKNNATVNFNKAVVLIAKGDIENAETYLGRAGGVGSELNFASGAVAIVKGDYKKAVSSYGNAEVNNAALAKILNKDYSGAKNILKNIKNPDAKTYYLQSIVAARTNDSKALLENVAETLNADKSYKDKFLKDVEFREYVENGAFNALF